MGQNLPPVDAQAYPQFEEEEPYVMDDDAVMSDDGGDSSDDEAKALAEERMNYGAKYTKTTKDKTQPFFLHVPAKSPMKPFQSSASGRASAVRAAVGLRQTTPWSA